ncbi:MAG: hypothetical protein IJB57_10655 [Clostridia bacterium]|nr:hypothetical protein [Clostridia bacterium]
MKNLKCLRCGEQMHFLAQENIQLGKTGWVLGDIPNLLAGALDVDIFICPACHKLEFYASDNEVGDDDLPKKTCPVCGTVHDFDYPQCPKCKHNYYEN